jgi:RNA polymerase sigma-70 factor (ECF subfamily)
MASIARNRAIDVVRKKSESSIGGADRDGSGGRFTRSAGAARDDGRVEAVAGMRRPSQPDRQKLVLLAYYNGWSREQLAASSRRR